VRDASAPDLSGVLAPHAPHNQGRTAFDKCRISCAPDPSIAAEVQTSPMNGVQKALVGPAANLAETHDRDLQALLKSKLEIFSKARRSREPTTHLAYLSYTELGKTIVIIVPRQLDSAIILAPMLRVRPSSIIPPHPRDASAAPMPLSETLQHQQPFR
jgi:hypothetical protein